MNSHACTVTHACTHAPFSKDRSLDFLNQLGEQIDSTLLIRGDACHHVQGGGDELDLDLHGSAGRQARTAPVQ